MEPSDFITFCQLNDDSCAFLIRAPKLKKFTREAKEQLCELAWLSAHTALTNANVKDNLKLAVGLRGLVSYATIYSGSYSEGAEDTLTNFQKHKGGISGYSHFYPYFYPYFAPDKIIEQVAASDPSPSATPQPD